MPHFLILIAEPDHYARWEPDDPAARAKVFASFKYFHEEVRAAGAYLAGGPLAHPKDALTMRPSTLSGQVPGRLLDEGPPVTGPDQLCGFYLIDVPDRPTAGALAALLPREYSIEVRECLDH